MTFRSMASEMALPNAGILDRLLGELEDPPLRLDGGRVEDPDAGRRAERLHVVRPHAIDDVELAGPQRGDAGRQLRDEPERHLLDLGDAGLPVVGVGVEDDLLAVGPAPELERAGPDRLLEEGLLVRGGRLGEHPQHREVSRQRAERLLGRHDDGEVAVLLDVLDVLVHERLDQLRVVADALERVDDAVRGERGAVVELDALPQVEPPRRVVHGRPRLREAGHELRVVRHLDQRVVDVAEDRGRRDRVVVRRVEREHPLGEAGDDLALSGLGGRRARPGAGRGEGGARADQDLAPGELGRVLGGRHQRASWQAPRAGSVWS